MMKILAISDQIIDRIYSISVRETYPDVQAILSCGDLPYEYLEFLVSIYNVPLLYVPGNHDPEYTLHDARSRAHGCENIDGSTLFLKGLFFAGLGGSVQYQPGTPNQYTQQAMFLRVYRMLPALAWQKIRYRRTLDVLLTHSPPFGIHDDDDPAHHGLHALNLLVRLARPRHLLHGHTIFYRQNLQDHVTHYNGTKIINIYPFRVMNLE
jgi:Icc-related predicted phosphoesterase